MPELYSLPNPLKYMILSEILNMDIFQFYKFVKKMDTQGINKEIISQDYTNTTL